MSEHVWQWGDWGRSYAGTIVKFVTHWNGNIFLSENGSVCNLCDVKYLPDCTGYDWKPIEPSPPPGYRLLRPKEKVRNWDMALRGEKWVELLGERDVETEQIAGCIYARKIEPQYRPFKDGAEFKPHRDRWVKWKTDDENGIKMRIVNYSNALIWVNDDDGLEYTEAFERLAFDNGEPFGVENK